MNRAGKDMMLQSRVKKLLAEGKAAWGSALADASELLAKATLKQGIDFLWIDTEHRPFGINEVQLIPMLCRLEGRDAMLRVPNLDPGLIKKGLDMGCSCIMVPQVDNAEQARLAVEYCKYPPEGNRGVGPVWPMLLDVDINDYLESANRETCVIVQVETAEGLANLERIAEVEGVDVVFAGPADISASLGHLGNIGHPEVQKCLETFPARAAACGKPSGITFNGFDACWRAYEQGYRFINSGNLMYFGQVGMGECLSQLRKRERAASG